MIRVASYNIRKCIGTDRRRVPQRVIDVLHEVDADVVALQEADRRFGQRPSAIPSALLESAGYRPAALSSRAMGIGWHGNAILVREGAKVIDCRPLHLPTLEPRGAVLADIDFGGGRALRVIGMHLDLSGLWRRRQVRALMHHVEGCERDLPTVIMGDMNEWTRRGGSLREVGAGFAVAATGRSFHSQRPVAQLDRIIHDARLNTLACGVHSTPLARRASDHLPIWADMAAPGWDEG